MAVVMITVQELVPRRQPKRVKLSGTGILVARVGEQVYAIADKCPPRMLLKRGYLGGDIISCTCHGSKFDITSGMVVAWIGKHSTIGSSLPS